MKKICIISFCLLSFLNVQAQRLAVDKSDSEGNRTVITQYYDFYRDFITGYYSEWNLGCSKVKDTKLYQLCFKISEGYSINRIDAGRKILIKFEDDSILELENNGAVSTYCPSYLIKEDDIQRIINGKVVKIRIERNIDVIDKEIKKNKFSKRMKTAYESIQKALSVDKNVYSGF